MKVQITEADDIFSSESFPQKLTVLRSREQALWGTFEHDTGIGLATFPNEDAAQGLKEFFEERIDDVFDPVLMSFEDARQLIKAVNNPRFNAVLWYRERVKFPASPDDIHFVK